MDSHVNCLAEEGHFEVDPTDLACLTALQVNPRGTWRDLSAACDVPERTLSRRLQRLMEGGYVKVIGELDPVAGGSGPVLHAWLQVENGKEQQVARHLAALPQTQVVLATTGAADLFAEINAQTQDQLSDLVVRLLPQVPGLRQVESRIVLRSFRRASRWRIDGSVPAEPVPQGDSRCALNADEARLLEVLTSDGRASLGVLAEACGVSEPKVQRLISGLVERHVLTFRVELEPSLVGYGVVIAAATALCFSLAQPIARGLGKTGINVMTRLMGLILVMMATQMFLDGIRAWMKG